jgi:hypothetical protein
MRCCSSRRIHPTLVSTEAAAAAAAAAVGVARAGVEVAHPLKPIPAAHETAMA